MSRRALINHYAMLDFPDYCEILARIIFGTTNHCHLW